MSATNSPIGMNTDSFAKAAASRVGQALADQWSLILQRLGDEFHRLARRPRIVEQRTRAHVEERSQESIASSRPTDHCSLPSTRRNRHVDSYSPSAAIFVTIFSAIFVHLQG